VFLLNHLTVSTQTFRVHGFYGAGDGRLLWLHLLDQWVYSACS